MHHKGHRLGTTLGRSVVTMPPQQTLEERRTGISRGHFFPSLPGGQLSFLDVAGSSFVAQTEVWREAPFP